MKPSSTKLMSKKNGYQSDDDNVRYKLNEKYFNNVSKTATKSPKKAETVDPDNDIRYKFPTVLVKSQAEKKPKQKIKVNFWSGKQYVNRIRNAETNKEKTNRRHTVGAPTRLSPINKPKSSPVKVRKRVSFLPSPLFSDNHVPMVTVPDDLTIHLNEEEANDIGEDLNQAVIENDIRAKNKSNDLAKRKSQTSAMHNSPKGAKRKHSNEEPDNRGHGNENDLEFFSKYVVQKLRKMETNQRIYSENLINTVLMLGQLAKLNGKSKIQQQ